MSLVELCEPGQKIALFLRARFDPLPDHVFDHAERLVRVEGGMLA
jgi:hypothetical protein